MPEAAAAWAAEALGNALLAAGAETATAAAVATAIVDYGATAMLAGGLAYSTTQARKAAQAARDQYNAAQVDRLQTISSAIAPRDLVLGRVRKAGSVFYKASTSAYLRDLYLAIAFAGHEIDAYEQWYLNDVPVTLDGSGWVLTAPWGRSDRVETVNCTGYPTDPAMVPGSAIEILTGGASGGAGTGNYTYQRFVATSTVQITKYLGAPGQTANADLIAAFPSDWTSANVVQGVAYVVARFVYDENAFPSGLPTLTAVIRGAKVVDPRVTSGLLSARPSGAPAGSVYYATDTALYYHKGLFWSAGQASAAFWSANPALLMRYVYAHPKIGKATITAAEDVRFCAAASACDTSTVYTVGGVAQDARELYSASLVAPFGTPAKSLFDDLSQAMGGSWAFAGGELHLKAGTYTASVMALTDADLAVIMRSGASETQRPIAISVHKDRAAKFNTIKPTIWDAAQDYKQVALTPLAASALVTRDGAELVQEVTMPAIGYAPQALHVAGILMRDARDPLTVELPCKLRVYPLELFDTVTLTLARYGWTAKTFMVTGRVWNPDGSIQLTLKETAAAITTMDSDFSPQGFAANTNLPEPWLVADVGTLTVASGTAELLQQADGTIVSRMRITWTQVPDAAVVDSGHVEVQYRKLDETGPWTSIVVPGDETEAITSEVMDGIVYVVRARAKTAVATGEWCVQTSVAIVGKTALPGNPAGLTATSTDAGILIAWIASTEADYAYTEIRHGASWAAGSAIFKGRASSYLWPRPATASYTFYAKHFDTTGNESATAANTTIAYTLPVISNTAITVSGGAISGIGTGDGAFVSNDLGAGTASSGPLFRGNQTTAGSGSYAAVFGSPNGDAKPLRLYAETSPGSGSADYGQLEMNNLTSDPSTGGTGQIAFVNGRLRIHDGTSWRYP